ncbi:hypothetical protein [Thiocapsa sp.]|uniref:hypothetical protein n=1 Tax=Thiocapsa sp. TaxID=2024551 RepID=UPI002607ED0F|nr:hypothetical protein [Thiocapsa sp.]
MNPTRARIGDALILILLGCCMASHAATPATRETITTPPPGSRSGARSWMRCARS